MTDSSDSLGQIQAIRRSVTLPTKLISQSTRGSGAPNPSHADNVIFYHPSAKIVHFAPRALAPIPSSSAPSDFDYPVDTIETLPWRSATERTVATAPLRLERVHGLTVFLKCGNVVQAILKNSQCWCVDGVSKFVLRIRPLTYYRIEIPNEPEENKELVEDLKSALPTVLRYEVTPCPFKRAFTVELPEEATAPRRKKAWRPKGRKEGVAASARGDQSLLEPKSDWPDSVSTGDETDGAATDDSAVTPERSDKAPLENLPVNDLPPSPNTSESFSHLMPIRRSVTETPQTFTSIRAKFDIAPVPEEQSATESAPGSEFPIMITTPADTVPKYSDSSDVIIKQNEPTKVIENETTAIVTKQIQSIEANENEPAVIITDQDKTTKAKDDEPTTEVIASAETNKAKDDAPTTEVITSAKTTKTKNDEPTEVIINAKTTKANDNKPTVIITNQDKPTMVKAHDTTAGDESDEIITKQDTVEVPCQQSKHVEAVPEDHASTSGTQERKPTVAPQDQVETAMAVNEQDTLPKANGGFHEPRPDQKNRGPASMSREITDVAEANEHPNIQTNILPGMIPYDQITEVEHLKPALAVAGSNISVSKSKDEPLELIDSFKSQDASTEVNPNTVYSDAWHLVEGEFTQVTEQRAQSKPDVSPGDSSSSTPESFHSANLNSSVPSGPIHTASMDATGNVEKYAAVYDKNTLLSPRASSVSSSDVVSSASSSIYNNTSDRPSTTNKYSLSKHQMAREDLPKPSLSTSPTDRNHMSTEFRRRAQATRSRDVSPMPPASAIYQPTPGEEAAALISKALALVLVPPIHLFIVLLHIAARIVISPAARPTITAARSKPQSSVRSPPTEDDFSFPLQPESSDEYEDAQMTKKLDPWDLD
ncbi:uncharacterized protein N7483_000093 [Penicillium malachiteum]|uniref:uncharacterized protein n=1 Tax=Penicillium malachiteum TaxID=1324776 RepID=UPI0025492DDE|nr:uncharacterized protein N7483_000093 [Penicillium malachiteum]KAJ5734968.1 hypothetical protein N7483_000093 [Penicillium malachiteum]